jgi:hypothetical protein
MKRIINAGVLGTWILFGAAFATTSASAVEAVDTYQGFL